MAARPGGGTGRRASLRGWWASAHAGSIPVPGSFHFLFSIRDLRFAGRIPSKKVPAPFFLLGDKEFGAGGEAVGVGKIITVGGEDFTPLTRGAIVFGGDRRKSVALLDDVNSWGLFCARI